MTRILLDPDLPLPDTLRRCAAAVLPALRRPVRGGIRIELDDAQAEAGLPVAGGPAVREPITVAGASAGQVVLTCDPAFPLSADERRLAANLAAALSLHAGHRRDRAALGQSLSRVDLLRRILDDSPAIALLWELSEGWPVAFVSAGISQFGYTAGSFLEGDLRFADIVHPDDLDQVAQEVAGNLQAGKEFFLQRYRIRTADGDTRWVNDWTHVLREPDGRASRAQGIILDVTESREAEERSQRYLQLAGAMFVAFDRQGHVMAVNDRTCKVVEAGEADLIGADWIERFLPEEGRQDFLDLLDGVWSGSLADQGQFEGELLTVEGWRRIVRWQYGVERSPAGEIDGIIAFGDDVTEEREASRRAHSMARLVNENPNPVLRLDNQGDVLLANPAAQQLIASLAESGPDSRRAWTELVAAARDAVVRKARELRIGDRIFMFDAVPVPRECYCNLYGIEVTATRAAEESLQAIADSMPGGIFLYAVSPDGQQKVAYRNQGCFDIWEIPGAVVAGDAAPLWDMIHPEDRAAMEESVNRSAARMAHWTHEWRIRPPSGRTKWVRGSGTPQRRANGDIVWNSLILDVTAEKVAAEEVANALKKTISVLAAAVEARDPYTAGHEERVAAIAVAIGRRMGLDAHRLTGLELAASVHDVGKIKVPSEILSKPTRLSDAEFALIKMHPEVGAELLREVAFDWPIADIILQHHERIDGAGYPRGLKGDQILLEARILGVADTLEAMASHRPYRPGLGIEAAAAEIRAGAGRRYDAAVARACLDLVESGGIQL